MTRASTKSRIAEASPAKGPQVDLDRRTDAMDIHRRNGRLLTTEAELRGWLGRTKPGDAFHYHRGYLPLDIVLQAKRVIDHEWCELGRVAQCALDAVRRCLAHVVQRRHGRFDYTYSVVARTPRLLDTLQDAAPRLEHECARLRRQARAFGLSIYLGDPDNSSSSSVCGRGKPGAAAAEAAHLGDETCTMASASSCRAFRVTETHFCEWLTGAQHGERLEYHRGFLAVDAIHHTGGQPASRCALGAAQTGRVHLLQRRHGNCDYSYYAIARDPDCSGKKGSPHG